MAIPTLTDADTYHALRGNDSWEDLTDEAKTAALHRASDYISAFYSLKAEVEEDDDVLLNAITVLAAVFATDTPAMKQDPKVVSYSEELGPIKESKTYAAGSYDPYPQVTGMMKSILRSTVSGVGIGKLVN